MGIEQHCTKETLQPGKTLATLLPILTGPRIEMQTSRSDGGVFNTNADRSF